MLSLYSLRLLCHTLFYHYRIEHLNWICNWHIWVCFQSCNDKILGAYVLFLFLLTFFHDFDFTHKNRWSIWNLLSIPRVKKRLLESQHNFSSFLPFLLEETTVFSYRKKEWGLRGCTHHSGHLTPLDQCFSNPNGYKNYLGNLGTRSFQKFM